MHANEVRHAVSDDEPEPFLGAGSELGGRTKHGADLTMDDERPQRAGETMADDEDNSFTLGHICSACGGLVLGEVFEVAPVADDEAWESIAAKHRPECPFVLGRAGKRAVYIDADGELVVNRDLVIQLAEAANVTDSDVILYLRVLANAPEELRHDVQVWVETSPIADVALHVREVLSIIEEETSNQPEAASGK